MVVDDVGEVVGRHAIALQEDLVLELFVLDRDVAVEHVEERRLTRERHLLADDVGVAVLEVLLDDLRCEVAAGTVVAAELAGRVILVRVAEAVVGVARLDEFLGVLLVEVHALTLDVGAVRAAERRALIRDDVSHLERAVDEIDGVSDVARAVRVLDAQDELTLLRFCVKVAVKGRAQVADVHVARRARREARADSLLSQWNSSSLYETYALRNIFTKYTTEQLVRQEKTRGESPLPDWSVRFSMS